MMRSLWSGVSGLQTHQVAMDVEGNNIANVNTTGFKYSRVDFGTMFSQTVKIATGPNGNQGGQNPLQVGLGSAVNSTTRIHSQGSIQSTEKTTDVAIEGDGFFMVSDDGGLTRYLTRNGDFKLDAAGNFVNNAGYVVQGWNRDPMSGLINNSASPTNIFIDPGMNIPAKMSTELAIKANLNSGLSIGNAKSPIYALDSVHGFNTKNAETINENDPSETQFYTTEKNANQIIEKGVDAGSLYNGNGEGLNLRDGQGIWVSYADAKFSTNTDKNPVFNPDSKQDQNNVVFWGNEDNPVTLDITINGVHIYNENIKSIDEAIAYINTFAIPDDNRDGTGVKATRNADGSGIDFVNTNADGTTDNMKNIDLTVNAGNEAGEIQNVTWNNTDQKFEVTLTQAGQDSDWFPDAMANAGTNNHVQVITAHKYTYSSSPVDIPPMSNPDGGPAYNPAEADTPGSASANYQDALMGSLLNTNTRVFRTTEDLRELLQRDARYGVDYDGSGDFSGAGDVNGAVKVTVNSSGAFVISNPNSQSDIDSDGDNTLDGKSNPKDMNFNITAYKDKAGTVSTNDAFTKIFKGFDGPMTVGSAIKESEAMYLSSFSASLDIYDSLGSKHTIVVEFTKLNTTADGGNEWSMIIKVPEPAEINATGEGPNNIIVGSARFNNDGSLVAYNPKTINFSPNNGAMPNQQIKLSFGSSGGFDGIVSNSQQSALTAQKTDGYAGGSLQPESLKVDESGYIWGEFTNGQALALAQIGIANVSNNAGLEEIGGNMFKLTANSGDLIIGEAGTGGRGKMHSSALEMSNVDLSRSLTQLIVVQRGYQANSKTISTSDQMLNTLLQLKQ
ncbi:flagellar hook protein FlgE [Campylobacter sp. CCS1377]|uniref:Flagellar hook protein FlgE n=1 Tax=Campylobacter sp. CCS1377 TaxID=3158229 RepID=A0AAU7E8A2_9BACT